jgi:hypothetical protein
MIDCFAQQIIAEPPLIGSSVNRLQVVPEFRGQLRLQKIPENMIVAIATVLLIEQ